jgi:sulfatase maturation enzyme AslB (radical SAM superfamily)
MIAYPDIRDVHLELSTFCNAACPLCPRNFRGYPYNDGYPETNFTLEHAKKIFSKEFIQQLDRIWINGNYGDAVMNPETVPIVEYFRQHNSKLMLEITTNGSARNKKFWQDLAKARVLVRFCLDGLEDTHHLYRQNTSWQQIINNAKIFMQAGGVAVWKFIEFDHNRHQITACRQLASELGFEYLELINHSRNTGPVFNRHGQHQHNIGTYTGTTDFEVLFYKKKTDQVLLEDITTNKTPKDKIVCRTVKDKSIYVAANGDISPCCYLGFYPATYGQGEYFQAVNAQIKPLVSHNNALLHPLEDCIAWFNSIVPLWNIDSYEQGRLIACDDACGSSCN